MPPRASRRVFPVLPWRVLLANTLLALSLLWLWAYILVGSVFSTSMVELFSSDPGDVRTQLGAQLDAASRASSSSSSYRNAEFTIPQRAERQDEQQQQQQRLLQQQSSLRSLLTDGVDASSSSSSSSSSNPDTPAGTAVHRFVRASTHSVKIHAAIERLHFLAGIEQGVARFRLPGAAAIAAAAAAAAARLPAANANVNANANANVNDIANDDGSDIGNHDGNGIGNSNDVMMMNDAVDHDAGARRKRPYSTELFADVTAIDRFNVFGIAGDADVEPDDNADADADADAAAALVTPTPQKLRGRHANPVVEGRAAWQRKLRARATATRYAGPVLDLSLFWAAPFESGGGYCMEATTYVMFLQHRVRALRIVPLGDDPVKEFVEGLSDEYKQALLDMSMVEIAPEDTVFVCHTQPSAWGEERGCPLEGAGYRIGRTMFETDRLPPDWVHMCNKMDEIWVPSSFHVATFVDSGVAADKLVVLPESVDTAMFDPARTPRRPDFFVDTHHGGALLSPNAYKFLSVFKWETRKGWDVLLSAFFLEFRPADNAHLFILTKQYLHKGGTNATVHAHFAELRNHTARADLDARIVDHVHFLPANIPLAELPSVYKTADAFVLPSRGEGWGRPHSEAMAMGMPCISTNWSGNTEFMHEDNSFPIRVDTLQQAEDDDNPIFSGHKWAKPSVTHLAQLMRHVMTNRTDAAARGARARHTMLSRYSPSVVSNIMLRELKRIRRRLHFRQRAALLHERERKS